MCLAGRPRGAAASRSGGKQGRAGQGGPECGSAGYATPGEQRVPRRRRQINAAPSMEDSSPDLSIKLRPPRPGEQQASDADDKDDEDKDEPLFTDDDDEEGDGDATPGDDALFPPPPPDMAVDTADADDVAEEG